MEESGQEYALVNIFFADQSAPFLVRLVRGC
jgi:hypothetical protein